MTPSLRFLKRPGPRRRLTILVTAVLVLALTVIVLGETTGRRSGLGYVWGGPSFEVDQGPATLFSDDFSNPGSGWEIAETEEASAGYDAGQYRIVVRPRPLVRLQLHPLPRATDGLRLEVDAIMRAGNSGDSLGVVCGGSSAASSTGYLAGVDPGQGAFTIYRYNATAESITMEPEPLAEGVVSSLSGRQATNRLRLECMGDAIFLTVNERRAARIDSESRPARFDHVGFFAANDNPGSIDAWFDNLIAQEIRP